MGSGLGTWPHCHFRAYVVCQWDPTALPVDRVLSIALIKKNGLRTARGNDKHAWIPTCQSANSCDYPPRSPLSPFSTGGNSMSPRAASVTLASSRGTGLSPAPAVHQLVLLLPRQSPAGLHAMHQHRTLIVRSLTPLTTTRAHNSRQPSVRINTTHTSIPTTRASLP